ncbi:cupredoxin domain-containing protein [Symbiobacterium terraclitae]|uniref:cupredoxin domain-containing protein n=1 Tax=Symbiobacterium terraclitae TaxID=557451 RepID=UPI0035B51246
MRRTPFMAVLLLTILTALSGCGGAGAEPPAEPAEGEVTVVMKAMKFSPAELTVKAGTKITFVNQDAIAHDVVQSTVRGLWKETPAFDSGVIRPGESWTLTIDEPGTYPFLCSQAGHYTAGMVGTITVVE